MKSQATNDAGHATELLLAAAMNRIIDRDGTPEDSAKLKLIAREEFITAEVEEMMTMSLEALNAAAETIAVELLNALLYPED
jgi:hypothetical protein